MGTQTPVSGANPYCTVTQFLNSYDVRTVGQLLSDNNTQLTPTQVQNSAALAQLLGEASGWVEAAVLRGNRASAADLAALAAAGGNGAAMLAGIVAGITMFFVWDRRPATFAQVKLPLKAELAMQLVDRIDKGERILPFQESADAGNPDPQFVTPQEVQTRNFASVQARRLFGDRGYDFVPGS